MKVYKLSPDRKTIEVTDRPDPQVKGLRNPRLGSPTGETYALRYSKPVSLRDSKNKKHRTPRLVRGKVVYGDSWDYGDPQLLAAQHRAIKTQRQAITRKLDNKGQHLTVKERKALLKELRILVDLESQLFGVKHKALKSFSEYGGRFPNADDIIHNAVIWRCLKSGKPHLILPKLAAMFPENYSAALAQEVELNPQVRRVLHRMNAGQIKGRYHDPVERLIAENYFESSVLPKPLNRLSRDEAVEQLEKHFRRRITVDKYRRHVKSLFLREYS